ncbi:hypothetical protein ACOMHN_038349 [Nucella lapillus]
MATPNDESDAEDVLTEELLALEAIYFKEEISVKHDEKNRPQSIAVKLHPATGMDESKQYVCMTLCFNFPPGYPDAVPDIMVKEPRGLGEENLQSLIQYMLKKAEERKGGQMLYELIEMAKDCLTEGNLPHCECAICLDHFEEGDNFVKTDCYHYFHRTCLARCAASFVAGIGEEPQPAFLHGKKTEENVFRCPMCRVPLTCDLDDLLTETPTEEKEVAVVMSPELIHQQQERTALYDRQKAKGGIIDLEEEKNKYLVDENTVVSLFRSNGDTNGPSSEKPPESNEHQNDREPTVSNKTDRSSYNKGEGGKPRENHGTNQGYASNRWRKSYIHDGANVSQGYSDYEEEEEDSTGDRHKTGSGRGDRTRGRGRVRKHRESQPLSDRVSGGNHSWKSDRDFFSSGQGYDDFEPLTAEDVRHDGPHSKRAHGNSRGQRRGGRNQNRAYHRDDREHPRDGKDDKNYRRDHDANGTKHSSKDCAENLGDREKNIGDKRETSGEGKNDGDRRENSGPGQEHNRDGGRDGGKNFGKDTKRERHDGTSPRDHRDHGPPRKERLHDGHWEDDWHDGTSTRGHRDRRPPRRERLHDGHWEDDWHDRTSTRGHRDHRPPRRERLHDGYTKDGHWEDDWHDGTSPRDQRDRGPPGKEHPRGQYRENRRNRRGHNDAYQAPRGDRGKPGENREHNDARRKEHPRETEDWENDRDSPRNDKDSPRNDKDSPRNDKDSPRQLAETKQGPRSSPRDGEGSSRHQDFGNNGRDFPDNPRDNDHRDFPDNPRGNEGYSRRNDHRDFPDNRYRNQRSDDGRHGTYQRRGENYRGSRREDMHETNHEDTHTRGSQKREDFNHHPAKADGREKHRRHLADRQNSHESNDSETFQEDSEHGWNKPRDRVRGDRTFFRGRGSRGGRGQNRTPFSRSDAATMSQTTDRQQQRTEVERGEKNVTRAGGRSDRFHEDDWNAEDSKQGKRLPTAQQGSVSRKRGQSAKEGGRSRTSNKDRDTEPDFDKSQTSQGQRWSQKDAGVGDSEGPHREREGQCGGGGGHRPPPGFPSQGPPPGFSSKGTGEHPQVSDPAKAVVAKVSPPPGFS